MEYYVYAYMRKDGTPYYIGKGKGNRAWRKDKNEILVPKDKGRILILESKLTEIGALAIERRMIRWYGRKDIDTGILRNLTDGGDGVSGLRHTDAVREILRKVNLGNKNCVGRMVSKETGRKISEANKGIPRPNYNGGKPRKKRSDTGYDAISKDWIVMSPEGQISRVKNLRKLCREYNISQGVMSKVAKGQRRHYKGWQCRYEGDDTPFLQKPYKRK